MSDTAYEAHLIHCEDRWVVGVMPQRDGFALATHSTILRGAEVPTHAERTRALAELGYQLIDGAEWEWSESSRDDDPEAEVLLRAVTAVEEVA